MISGNGSWRRSQAWEVLGGAGFLLEPCRRGSELVELGELQVSWPVTPGPGMDALHLLKSK